MVVSGVAALKPLWCCGFSGAGVGDVGAGSDGVGRIGGDSPEKIGEKQIESLNQREDETRKLGQKTLIGQTEELDSCG